MTINISHRYHRGLLHCIVALNRILLKYFQRQPIS